MTHDYKGALEATKFNIMVGPSKEKVFRPEHNKTIQHALRLADRLASGDISAAVYEAGYEVKYFCVRRVFKAMASELIKETGE